MPWNRPDSFVWGKRKPNGKPATSPEQIDREKERAEDLLYGTEMTLAQRNLDEGDLEAAGQHLAENRPADRIAPTVAASSGTISTASATSSCSGSAAPDYPVTCVALSPDGRLIVTGSGPVTGIFPTARSRSAMRRAEGC